MQGGGVRDNVYWYLVTGSYTAVCAAYFGKI